MLNLLLIEDNPVDSRLLERYLQQQGIGAQCRRVETTAELEKALAEQSWDAVLSDYNLPGMDFQETLDLVRARLPDIPFILVSGSVGEMTAVELLKDGVWDFVLKDNLARLKSAIERAFRDREQRRAQRAAEQALQESQQRLSLALDAAQMGVWEWDVNTDALFFTPRCYSIFGLPVGNGRESLESFQHLVHPDDLPLVKGAADHAMQTRNTYACEFRIVPPGGGVRWIYEVGRFTYDEEGKPLRLVGTSQDITGKKLAEVTLRESEERFRLIAETVSEVFWMADVELEKIHYVSPAYEHIWQRSCASLYANPRSFIEAIHPADRERVSANLSTSEPAGRPFEHEYRVVRPDGSTCWVWERGLPVADPLGRATRYVGVVRDITARKAVEQELQAYRENLEEQVAERTAELATAETRLRLILESTADGLYGSDVEGRFTFVNPTACRLLGYAPQQLIGRPVHETIHHSRHDGTPLPIAECRQHAALFAGKDVRLDDECYWRSDGLPLPVSVAAQPMFSDGVVVGTVIGFSDNSERKRVEAEREEARAAAERFARIKSEFLANMSHEIRTPLNGVLGLARIGYRDSEGQKTRETFSRILDSGQLLMGIINDILDFSKIEAGKLTIEAVPVELPKLVDHTMGLLQERAQAKGIALTLDVAPALPAYCRGDPLRIGQILLNLLSNAVKFTEQGQVTLSVDRQGDALLFCVVDTGIGMSDEQLARLFSPFEQADGSTTRRFGGTGLGLTITKRLVEMMGGQIHVACKPAVGCTFEVRLPFVALEGDDAPRAAAAECVPAECGAQLEGVSILVAEDNEINRLVLEDLLASVGARVVLVENGKQAVERVAQDGGDAFDVVLMDVQMPEMDGFEATRRIGELAPGLPVVGQTAHAMAEEREKCLSAGMVDHVAKPIDPERLYATLRAWLRARPGGATSSAGTAQVKAPFEFGQGLADPAIIDLRVLAERFKNDNAKVEKFAGKFLENAGLSLAELDGALARRDVATLNAVGHRIKSAAQTVGAMRFAELCRQLEAHRPTDAIEGAARLVRDLHGLHHSIAERLHALVPGIEIKGGQR